jgi:hypothetical protein
VHVSEARTPSARARCSASRVTRRRRSADVADWLLSRSFSLRLALALRLALGIPLAIAAMDAVITPAAAQTAIRPLAVGGSRPVFASPFALPAGHRPLRGVRPPNARVVPQIGPTFLPGQPAPLNTGSLAERFPRLSSRLAALSGPVLKGASRRTQADRVRIGDRLVVEIRVRSVAGADVQLRAIGVEVLHVSPRYRTVTGAVVPTDIQAVGNAPGVEYVSEILAPLTSTAQGCPSGGAVSEADTQLLAASARRQFGVTGAGVKVGVISDSFDRSPSAATRWSTDVASGDLPGPGNPCGFAAPIQNLDDSRGGEDEGRAMAQSIHDLAPGVSLAFATAGGAGDAYFADNVRALAASGAKVIVDDVLLPDEPMFQDGPIAQAVSDVSAGGVAYYSAADNDNLLATGADAGSWEAPSFRAVVCPQPNNYPTMPDDYPYGCMNFDPTGSTWKPTTGFLVAGGGSIRLDLQWAEPWYDVTTNLDAFLVDQSGNVVATSTFDNIALQRPVEFVSYTNPTSQAQALYLVIAMRSGTEYPRLKYVLLQPMGGGVTDAEYSASGGGDTVGPTIFGHAGTADAISVAAVPYNSSAQIEPYSSRGPLAHDFAPVAGTTPAPRLSSPQLLDKPDLAATDCAVTSFFGMEVGTSMFRFCGTSQAAPHAAAVAALEFQEAPSATSIGIENVQIDTATTLAGYSADAQGAGLVNALAAVGKLAPRVSTGPATNVGSRAATLNATINANGYPTSYRFLYGTASSYGSITQLVDVGAGSNDANASVNVGGLNPNTTYHYQLVAVRAGAIVAYGSDKTFTTPSKQPPVNTSPPTIVGRRIPGAKLTCRPGRWSGATSFSYRWRRSRKSMRAGPTYRPRTSDVGHTLSCQVIASNGDGTTNATSSTIRIIKAPPRLTSLTLSSTVFTPARTGPSIVRSGISGTLVTFRLNERASVAFTIVRGEEGRRVRGRCQAETHVNRKASRCTRWSPVPGGFRVGGKSGPNGFRFSGRISGRALSPGSYRLLARAHAAAGSIARPVRASFAIRR